MGFANGFASVHHDGAPRFGLVDGQTIHLAPAGESLRQHIGSDLTALKARLAALPAISLDQVTFDPLIPDPAQVFCVGLNYRDHAEEMAGDTGITLPETPVVFGRWATTLAAHNQPIPKPHNVQFMDYEAELALIVGKAGRFIPEDQALDHIAGFTAFNDISMRDWQMQTTQWMPGKNFPASGPLGPVLVARDDFMPGFDERRIRLLLDGQVLQDSHFGQFIFPLPRLIAHISQFAELLPGDVIVTGTPGGIGYARKPRILLEPGKTVTVEIEGIGALTNPITA